MPAWLNRRLAAAGAGLIALLGAVSAGAQSSVWKVTRGDAVVYLGGTCHVLRERDFPLPREFDTAFTAASKLYFETDMERMRSDEIQRVIEKEGMFTDGRLLSDVLTPKVWRDVMAYTSDAGLPDDQVRRMKPWLLVILMAGIEMQKLGITSDGVDMHYFNRARSARKPIGELESFEDHIAFLTRLGAGRESEMLAHTLEDLHEVPQRMSALLAAWRAGDVAKLDELMLDEMRTEYPEIFQELLVSRNRNWLPRLEALFATPEVELVLVGVAHMAGPEGLLEQLRTRGYTIEQIVTPGGGRRAGSK